MNKEDFGDINWDEFLLSTESSVDYPHHHVSNPCSMSISSFSDALPPPSTKPYLEKGSSSTHPKPANVNTLPRVLNNSKVATPTKDQSSKGHRQRETHNVSQKRRRDKVKEKIDILKELIPNCDKKDMASVLDEGIKYIQLLKYQAQWYSLYQYQLHVQQSCWMRATWNPQAAASSSVWARGLSPYNLQYSTNINNYPRLHQPSQQPIITYNPPFSQQYVTTTTVHEQV